MILNEISINAASLQLHEEYSLPATDVTAMHRICRNVGRYHDFG
jgi:hypothetical protein